MTRKLLSRNALVAFASLAFASAVSVGMQLARIVYSHAFSHTGLVWNLILAWIPFIYAFIAYRLHRAKWRNSPLIFGCVVIWLLFLPNAPYLLTDLIHLYQRDHIPLWYDLIMLLWFAWTGFLLGFVSLYLMQHIIADSFGSLAGWLFAIVSLGLSAFGVYLGRFLRWNSWDVIRHPIGLFFDIYDRFRHPFAHFRTHVFWFLLALFLICIYVTLSTFAHLHYEPEKLNQNT